jgi:hypothetical protein
MGNVFDKSIKIGDYLVMEAYDNCISLWDGANKNEVTITVEEFDRFLKEFKQMAVELKVHRTVQHAKKLSESPKWIIPKGTEPYNPFLHALDENKVDWVDYEKRVSGLFAYQDKFMSLEDEIMLDKLSTL